MGVRRFRWDRLAMCVFWAIVGLLVLWVVASYCNIIAHNDDLNPTYTEWNIFTLTMADTP